MFNEKERYSIVNVYKVYTQDKFLVFIMFCNPIYIYYPFRMDIIKLIFYFY